MIEPPDVTFVIAAYNSAGTIRHAIESALAQRHVSIEVVVVDDASSDDTREVVGDLADTRLTLIALERNTGPGGARNAGLEAARGRWIAILDSDDTVEPDRLARMIARAEKADAQIVVDNLDVVSGDGSRQRMFSESDLARQSQLTLPAFIASNALFRSEHNYGYMKPVFLRGFLQQHALRFDETLRIGEDYILLASALARGGRCVVEPTAGYIYNVRDGSISRVLRKDHVEAMLVSDQRFLMDNRLDSAAQAAQRVRTHSLREARSFLDLVEHLKRGALLRALRTAISDPAAVRHLRMPIEARLRRLIGRPARAIKQSDRSPGKRPHTSKG
ncbi:succinoglycan biosynthesis protein ExoO [Rhizobium subbaraonis]|uniref:Succinoglycan biosynthesis protein ExoO n=1 Tax=Rhizobium subbaraonis TaxID=908946 RepID=A0A285U387_9HYPH|nr:glycosyltransferase family 2 protein [Rhizobium subbaraonis]SOC35878.1 succinoglycan biosynthesis protein ExoO [Rhizobium subbaraonis]